MKTLLCGLAMSIALAPLLAHAQVQPRRQAGAPPAPTRMSYVPLGGQATGVLIEPVTPDPVKGRIAVVVVHPGHGNMVNSFISRALPGYGYKVLAIGDNGPERTFYDLLVPLAAGIKALRAMPGVDKVVLAGNSTGDVEIMAYQDVAENGPAACQRPERIYKCTTKEATGLPKADGIMLLDGNAGMPENITGINPAVDWRDPHKYDAKLDMFSLQNGYDPKTGVGRYSPAFLKRFFAAQARVANARIAEAQRRLALIEKGQGTYQDNSFVVTRGLWSGEEKPEMANIGLITTTHAPHLLLKADGSRPVQIISLVKQPDARPANTPHSYAEEDKEFPSTVRGFLSGGALRLTADYHWTADNVYGIDWHSSPDSAVGAADGVHVPLLAMAGTCAVHVVWLELTYDHAASKDKDYVGVEGADHEFQPCRPEYGGSFKHAMDYVDAWLSKPGRL
jgi:hypothetical protein